MGPGSDEIFLIMYGSGIKNRTAGAEISVTLRGLPAEVLYPGSAPGFRGVDQINLRLPRTMANLRGSADIVLRISEPGAPAAQTSNSVAVRIGGN